MREIIFPEKIFKTVKDHILKDSPREQFAFLLCGHSKGKDSLKFLVREAVIPDKKDLAYQHSGGVCPKKDFQIQVYQRCYNEGFGLIDVHSHPFSSEKVIFSPIDDVSEFGTTRKEGTFPYLARKINGIYLASIVFGKTSIDARLYVPEHKKAFPIDRIKILGNTVEDITPTSSHREHENCFDKDSSLYSRQILAFGAYGQEKLSRTSVGVIGAGGIGSIVIECLARLGVREIVCVDDDIVEESNISRMLGSFPDDAKNRRRKVEVLQHHVERINSRITFEGIVGSVLNPFVMEKLKGVDCLISGTDTQSSRLVLNSFSVQYLIPLIDLGTEIVLDGEGKRIDRAGGKVRIVRPGKWCLRCYPNEIDEREVARETASDFDRKRDHRLGYIRGAVDILDPSVISLNMTVASLGISEFLNLFVRYKDGATYSAYYLLRSEVKNVGITHGNDHCPICGRDGLLGLGDSEFLRDIRESGPLPSLPEPNFKRMLPHATDTAHYADKSQKVCLPGSARGSSTASAKTNIGKPC